MIKKKKQMLQIAYASLVANADLYIIVELHKLHLYII